MKKKLSIATSEKIDVVIYALYVKLDDDQLTIHLPSNMPQNLYAPFIWSIDNLCYLPKSKRSPLIDSKSAHIVWGSVIVFFQHAPDTSSSPSSLSPQQTANENEAELAWTSHKKPSAGLSSSSYLQRAGNIKHLINKFSGPHHTSSPCLLQSSSKSLESDSNPCSPSSGAQDNSPVPSITVTPATQNGFQPSTKSAQITAGTDRPVGGGTEKTESEPMKKTQTVDSGRDSVADSGLGSVRQSRPDVVA